MDGHLPIDRHEQTEAMRQIADVGGTRQLRQERALAVTFSATGRTSRGRRPRIASPFVEETERTGELGRLPALLHIKLCENILQMRLDGLGRDIERTRDFLV